MVEGRGSHGLSIEGQSQNLWYFDCSGTWNSADRNGKEGEIACEEKGGFKCLGFEVLPGCQVSLSKPDAGNPHCSTHTFYICRAKLTWEESFL